MAQPTAAPNPAEAYERFIAQNLFAPWTADLLQRAQPKGGERVLDLACGTGIVTRNVAPLVGPEGKICALDISPAMLELARRLVPSNVYDIECYEGSGTEMPFPDESFELVLCQQGLQFFPDPAAGLREIRRVLAPGGRAVVSTWRSIDQQPFMQAIDSIVSTHVMPGALDQPYALSDAARLEQLAREAGFEDVDVQQAHMSIKVQEPDTFAPMVMQAAAAVLPAFIEMPPEERQATIERMKADLAQATRKFVQDGELVLDSVTNVLVARR